ncbi:MAG: tRNA pseudouridine(38-40) synthase TruA [Planctomycetaceae bacterium]|jgi:tRNA pseudouridine38-40 synthase|nr:tRNA pseudouridine(38-40) synthase TruA [Planctomycetaceae bacterium]
MRNIRLRLAYDGTGYVGWQVQPNGPSVQAAVERAIQRLTGNPTRVMAAGRTDSGVHAIGQVANFSTGSKIPCRNIQSGLQHFLPDDIVVVSVDEVDASFHATYSATAKWYRYVIHNTSPSHPFLKCYAWQYEASLDVSAMHEAAQVLVGTHDFRAFETQFPNRASSVRTIHRLDVARHDQFSTWALSPRADEPATDDGAFVWIDVAADGFLYNMVRAIAGTLVQVGRLRLDVDDVTALLTGGSRSDAGETAPACGLYLLQVDYDQTPPVATS